MPRFVWLAVVLSVAIGCSKSKPKTTEADKVSGDPKPAPKPGPGTIPIPPITLPKSENPERIPRATLVELKKVFDPLQAIIEHTDSWLGVGFSSTRIAPGTLKKLAPYSKYLRGFTLVNCEVSDEELQSLPELPWVLSFDLQHSKGFTAAGVAKIAPMKRLKTLTLANTPITDAGLAGLATSFPALEELQLGGTATTDAGLKHIGKVTSLLTLRLNKTRITGSGFSDLAPLTKLQTIDLTETPVSDTGLAQMPPMPSLTSINLSLTTIGDAGLKSLVQKVPNLSDFTMQRTRITDASVSTFVSLAKLRAVTISGTKMTKAGADALKAKFPNVHVFGP